ncbi:hypothetical protein Rfer_0876 [Rhodoferax ferrireducens T118]|uniref:Uncharacterized protein n=1 Tax=Albidiferax ferrireducens (strain ATCC BAA-621 / DSM 15236 / T118) TaxID=338969 RepID=Q220C9_ALBFT|nr:hypothetical protein Rfer_0876 [Rhodoferax ferrireducens T118]
MAVKVPSTAWAFARMLSDSAAQISAMVQEELEQTKAIAPEVSIQRELVASQRIEAFPEGTAARRLRLCLPDDIKDHVLAFRLTVNRALPT